MKNLYSKFCFGILLITILLHGKTSSAAVGDTTLVEGLDSVHMDWNESYSRWVQFPDGSVTYGKILMKYRLGCPSSGCSQWDYTTQVFAEKKTGAIDSTVTQYPFFTVSNTAVDSVCFNTSPVYWYYLNETTFTTDSVIAETVQITEYSDPAHPTIATNVFNAFPGNFYNYIWDAGGNIVDSVYVGYDSLWHQSYHNIYTPYEVVEPFELARVMTPYAGGFANTWGRDFWFDVTDYAPVLKDSVNMRIYYDGWSDGFLADVDFYFIEGTPPRNSKRVRNIYPNGYYEYGITTNPIESHLPAKSFDIDASEKMAMIRVIPSGHSFGGPQNCAEFCNKSYHLFVDNTNRFNQSIWRTDCGMNPLMAQPGTWLYDRANWCPGERTLRRDHNLTPYITPGSSVSIDMNMDPYVYTTGAGFNPGYYLNTQLITYDSINFSLNAGIDEIIAPNNEFEYARFNPICNNPIVKIKNNGSTTLTSAVIHYGIKGGTPQTFNWTGSLGFNETETVTLGNLAWGSSSGTPEIFEAWTSNPNGLTDQYVYDDLMHSTTSFTSMMPSQFYLFWRTNLAYTETTYKLTDDQGNVLYTNQPLTTASAIYRDTFNLAPGCYELKITDSGKDGLSFFANSDGAGFARLMSVTGSPAPLKVFEPNFGTSLSYHFTVGFMTAIDEHSTATSVFQLAPNPAHDRVGVNLILSKKADLQLYVTNQLGQIVHSLNRPGFTQDIIDLDLSAQPAGMYFVVVRAGDEMMTKKLLLE